MKKFFLLFTLMLIGFLQIVHSQQLGQTLETYATRFQPEKIYIHYDKASYFAGQTVWFKAYLTEDGLPATSKTLYLDWITEDGKVLHHGVAPVVGGITNGQFDIPDDFTGKFIQVKAYTRWMLNFDTAFVYTKDIRILSQPTSARPAKPTINTVLRFFPEGGDLIEAVTNRIAFKANDQYGRPVKVRGVITDQQGNRIDSFKTTHNGMGSLFLIPLTGKTYSAKWKNEQGMDQITPLPVAKASGATMQVALQADKRIVSLQTTPELANTSAVVSLVGTMNQHLVFQTDIPLTGNGSARRVIPTGNLPSGILTLTLFDASKNAIAERVTFINNGEFRFQPQMQVARWGLSKRGRNEIEISVPDSIPAANLSVAITDVSIDADTAENIYTSLLLTNDIRGYVHNPAYYFTNRSDTLASQLDLVMLTNGWRRFQWENVAKGLLPKVTFPKDSTYLTLSGSVYGVSKSMLTGRETMVLMIKGKDSTMETRFVSLNVDGTFSDPQFIFSDTLRIYYQLKSKLLGSAEARFMTNRLPPPNYVAASKNFFNRRAFLDTAGLYRHSMLAYDNFRYQQNEKGKLLANVTVTAKAKPKEKSLEERYARGLFGGGDGQSFDVLNDPVAMGSLNVFNYIQGRVAGLQVNASSNPPSLTWRGGTPQLYLDEMPVDADMVRSIPMSDVAFIKVLRPPFMGTNGGSGGIAIYTRRGDDVRTTTRGGGLSSSVVLGYTPIREFSSPDYSRFDRKFEQTDVRTTLYWNPSVIPTKGKPAKLVFYNNDVTKAFRVIITGMTNDGLMTFHQEIME